MSTERSRDPYVILASVIICATVILVALIFLRLFRIPFFNVVIFGISYSAVHWLGWIGTLYIAAVTPLYSVVKRRSPVHLRGMLKVHVLGNLISVMLISIHFAHQVTRSPSNYPDLGTGIVLYLAMILLVSTGFMTYTGSAKRFTKQMRFLHPSVALTFYLTIVLHIIHGL